MEISFNSNFFPILWLTMRPHNKKNVLYIDVFYYLLYNYCFVFLKKFQWQGILIFSYGSLDVIQLIRYIIFLLFKTQRNYTFIFKSKILRNDIKGIFSHFILFCMVKLLYYPYNNFF